jgi:shikimate dehydrogenase
MQNAGLAALGLNWRYLACEVEPANLREGIAGAKAMNFIGLNLTVPHKLLAMEMMDALDDSARVWGAVNTVRFEGKDASAQWRPLGLFAEALPQEVRSQGFNTDADAITRSLREDLSFEPANASVLLLGAGGAGRVAALKLASENVGQLFLVNRTVSKAETIAAEIRHRHPRIDVSVSYPTRSVDLVINATSLGLRPDDSWPWDDQQFALTQAGHVYDMIYRPTETALLKLAKRAGCRTANGLGMLLYQGAKALELWTGQNPPIHVMRAALERNVYG